MAAIRCSFDLERDLIPQVSSLGVEGGVLVQVLNRSDETLDLLAAGRTHEFVMGVVGWVDLTAPDVRDQLALLAGSGPLVGVRHQLQAEPDPSGWLAREDVQRGLRCVAAAGLAFDLMLRPAQFEAAVRVVRRHPELTFVIDHAGKPDIGGDRFADWAPGMASLAREPNVACKLSGLATVAGPTWTTAELRPYTEHVFAQFGPGRVMFGSDWPVCTLGGGYVRWYETVRALVDGLSPREVRAVWRGTAERVYGLSRAREIAG
jgi:L-fuconolactonase